MTKKCFKCDGKTGGGTINLYGYPICDTCKTKLRLLSNETIQKYQTKKPRFVNEIERRLDVLERD